MMDHQRGGSYAPSVTPDLNSYRKSLDRVFTGDASLLKPNPLYSPVSEASTVGDTTSRSLLGDHLAEPEVWWRSGKRRAVEMARIAVSRACCGELARENLKLILLLVSIFIGGGLGFGLRAADLQTQARNVMYVSFVGDIFLNMLKVVILPLIVSSLITGLAQMESQTSGKIGARAITYYMTTTIIAVILGIVLVVTIRPGYYAQSKAPPSKVTGAAAEPAYTPDTFLDLIRNMFPPNIVQACIVQFRTVLTPPSPSDTTAAPTAFDPNVTRTASTIASTAVAALSSTTELVNASTVAPTTAPKLPDISTWMIGGRYSEGINILGVVVFSIVFGITISRSGEKGKPLALFFESLNEVTMRVVGVIMWVAPIGVLFLVAGQILKVEDFNAMIAQLGMYFMTVIVGLLAHGLILLPLVYFLFTRKNPYSFIAGATKAYATGFATSSSSATLPITIECCEVNNGVDPRISRFVLPIGATINMDGTALYEAVAAIFIAQTQGIELSFGSIVAVSITATAAAIGAAGVPQAGLVTLVMVLDAVGLPAEFVGSILAVDWLLDRIRTTINILGDVIGTGVVDHLCKSFLKKVDAEAQLNASTAAVTPLGTTDMPMQDFQHHQVVIKKPYLAEQESDRM